ncbi:MAG TPA: biopolymer transporter ExbD [Steroidobacteraceae bacterium]|nr:biopolymer transporter ExbD [Steroidobacteraceae bacterium]
MRHAVTAKVRQDESEIDLTPMLDVVFIMLIFFIVTASFIKESGIDVNRPDANTVDNPQEKKNILIQIGPDDEIFIDRRRVDRRAVRANVERLHAENPEATVVIQALQRAKTDTLIAVMDASRQAGVYNIAIAEGS